MVVIADRFHFAAASQLIFHSLSHSVSFFFHPVCVVVIVPLQWGACTKHTISCSPADKIIKKLQRQPPSISTDRASLSGAWSVNDVPGDSQRARRFRLRLSGPSRTDYF